MKIMSPSISEIGSNTYPDANTTKFRHVDSSFRERSMLKCFRRTACLASLLASWSFLVNHYPKDNDEKENPKDKQWHGGKVL